MVIRLDLVGLYWCDGYGFDGDDAEIEDILVRLDDYDDMVI